MMKRELNSVRNLNIRLMLLEISSRALKPSIMWKQLLEQIGKSWVQHFPATALADLEEYIVERVF